MGDLVEELTRGNVTEVKVVLASIVAALAVYQVVLMAVGYGKLRPPFLGAGSASRAHRAIGDAIVVVTVVVAVMCLSYFGLEEVEDTRGLLHALAATALLLVLAVKIAVVRWGHGLGRFLPVLGVSVLLLFATTWLTSAGDFLAGR
jgi:Family of unknown function (DUF6529)